MSIYATLRTTPSKCNRAHEMIYITRGASAELVYPLNMFGIEDIDQITFIFKQGGDFYGYSMFDDSADRQINSHFYLANNSEYPAVIFNLDSKETQQFKPNINIDYEVVIKLNTDSFETTGKKDSIIIEPQHPIAVVDSLYSYIKEESDDNK